MSNSNGTDVFNNPSNDYVNPGLSPCAGLADSNSFEFINKKKVGIISGSNIITSMSLADIAIPVTEWVTKKQIIQTGEIIYVPGLTKGLLNKTSAFNLPDFGYTSQEYFFSVDLSVNYYANFKLNEKNITGTADFDQNLDIDDALNLAFSDESVNISSVYDASSLNFVGNIAGIDFDISNVVLNIIDTSMNSNSPFPPIIVDGERIQQSYILEIDIDKEMPAMKYPNGAMLGYIMAANYPETCNEADKWLYTNNINTPFDVYYEQSQSTGVSDLSINKIITFDPPTVFGEVSTNFNPIIDVSISDLGVLPLPDIDSSIIIPPQSRLLSSLTINNSSIYEPIIINCIVASSGLFNNTIHTEDPSLLSDINVIVDTVIFKDSSVISTPPIDLSINISTDISLSEFEDSYIIGNSINKYDPSIYDPSMYDPSVSIYDPSNMILANDEYITSVSSSMIKRTNINSVFINNDTSILGNIDPSTETIDSSIQNTITDVVGFYSNFTGMSIVNSYLAFSDISKSIIYDTYIVKNNISSIDSSLVVIEKSDIIESNIIDSSIITCNIDMCNLDDNTIVESNITNSSLLNNSITDSSVQSVYVNYLELAPELWVPDVSSETTIISNSNIYDSSVSNCVFVDCSIYNSYVIDASLFGCQIYNSIFDTENTILDDYSKSVWINGEYDCSVSWTYDSSLLYEKYSKQIDVGMNGSGDDKVLSAGEYLDYITSHDLWEKFGPLSSKFSTVDPDNSNIKNLIGGFYVYNPHEYPVQLEYMLIN